MGFMDRMKSFFSENGDEIISQGVDAYEINLNLFF